VARQRRWLARLVGALRSVCPHDIPFHRASILGVRVASGDRQSRDIDARIRRATQRLDDEQQRLDRQFAGMEQALGASRAQQAWLAGMVKRYT
jgi:hypothetical protein